jgi:hypothetical protein
MASIQLTIPPSFLQFLTDMQRRNKEIHTNVHDDVRILEDAVNRCHREHDVFKEQGESMAGEAEKHFVDVKEKLRVRNDDDEIILMRMGTITLRGL